MTHQHTWNTVAGASAFFAVSGAAIGDTFQQYAGAIIAVVSVSVGIWFQIKQRIGEGRIKALEIELRESQLKAEIEEAKHKAKGVIDQAAVVAADLIKTAADDAQAKPTT